MLSRFQVLSFIFMREKSYSFIQELLVLKRRNSVVITITHDDRVSDYTSEKNRKCIETFFKTATF